jgi:hypothetical protein
MKNIKFVEEIVPVVINFTAAKQLQFLCLCICGINTYVYEILPEP